MILRNVHVIDISDGSVLHDREVVVEEGVFAEIRESSQAEGSPIVDGQGGYLIPGLWEAHTHLVVPGARGEEEVAAIARRMQSYVRAGITSVVDLGGSLETLAAVRLRCEATPRTAARVYFAGPCFTGTEGWPVCFHHDHSKALEPRTAADASEQVLALRGRTDVVKAIYDGVEDRDDKMPKEVLGAVIDAAHAIGSRAIVHVKSAQDVRDAVELGADCLEHAFLPADPGETHEAEELAALLAKHGTYYCPTLVTWEQISRMGDPDYLAELEADGIPAARERPQIFGGANGKREFPRHPRAECLVRFRYGMKSIAILRDAGVKLVAGSDVCLAMSAPHALLRELQLLWRAGLSNFEVLRAATVHAAERTGHGQAEIKPGYAADAVLLGVNPLTDIRALVEPTVQWGVLLGGVWSADKRTVSASR